jgi:LysM domain
MPPVRAPRRYPTVNTRARPRQAPGRSRAPDTPPGHVQIYCADPPRSIVTFLGPDPIKLSGGGGGWEVVGRPHQIGMTLWQGGDPYTVQLPLMFDDFPERGSVERAVRVLNRLARGDDDSEPGIVEIGGVPLPADEWVIDSLDWGDPIRAPSDLRLLRQPVTVTLREYVPPEYLQLRRRALAKPKRRTRVVTVKKGDTPAKIARRVHCKWTALRELNPGVVKKANQPVGRKGDRFKVGMKLRAPVTPERRKGKGRGARGRGRTGGDGGTSGSDRKGG